MRAAHEVSIRRCQGPDDKAPTSQLLIDGVPIGRPVAGAVLEAAIACGDLLLLFMTDDTPFEESLSIHLLDRQGRLLDSARLGWPYTTGSFTALRLVNATTVCFRFFGDTDWTLQILPRPSLRIPFFPDAPGVTRSLGFKRWFAIQGKPARQPT